MNINNSFNISYTNKSPEYGASTNYLEVQGEGLEHLTPQSAPLNGGALSNEKEGSSYSKVQGEGLEYPVSKLPALGSISPGQVENPDCPKVQAEGFESSLPNEGLASHTRNNYLKLEADRLYSKLDQSSIPTVDIKNEPNFYRKEALAKPVNKQLFPLDITKVGHYTEAHSPKDITQKLASANVKGNISGLQNEQYTTLQ